MCLLVGANTGSFEGLGAQLFVLIGNHVDAERELVNIGSFATEIEDSCMIISFQAFENRSIEDVRIFGSGTLVDS